VKARASGPCRGAGASLVAYYETRSLDRETRVGWGACGSLARSPSLEVAVAVVILAAVSVALLL
jgi:hypothetical protein